MKETEDIQNILTRLEREIYLNVEFPSIAIKRQYYKATMLIRQAIFEFDVLNDLKEKAARE